MPTLLDQLTGDDRRTLGRSAAVAAQVLVRPELIDELFDGLASGDEILMGRAADALEKVARVRPDLLQPYKRELLTRVTRLEPWVVRAHACQLLALLPRYTPAERRRALQIVRGFLSDRSSIVKALALDCIVRLSLAPGFAAERTAATALVEACATVGETPALRARARILRKLLAKLARASRA
jgi:hypothetical protein